MLIRRLLLSTSLVVPAALSLANAAHAQDTFDWSGFYVGAGIAATESTTSADISYTGSEDAGWTEDGFFAGDIYDDVNNASVSAYDEQSYELDLDSLDSWVTGANSSNMGWAGTVFGGYQQQFGNVVVGAELRASTGDVGTSYSNSWLDGDSDSGDATCADEEEVEVTCTAETDLPSTGGAWTGYDNIDGAGMVDGDTISISGSVNQANYMGFSSNIGASFSAVARLGIANDRLMVYGLAGPTVATVSASTQASSYESGQIDVTGDFTDSTAHLDGTQNYLWQGSTSESRAGVEVGIGAELAITDNIILRGEASYSNFGSLSVTGVSEDTDATYKVTQQMSKVTAQTGILFKF